MIYISKGGHDACDSAETSQLVLEQDVPDTLNFGALQPELRGRQ